MSKKEKKTETSEKPQFSIKKVYTKNISFETSPFPKISENEKEKKPVADMRLDNKATPLDGDLYDVELIVSISVEIADTNIYSIEVNQAGIFLINHLAEDALERVLATFCLDVLFPYVRETISDIVARGGFPQMLLSPVNFDALYLQKKQAEETSEATS